MIKPAEQIAIIRSLVSESERRMWIATEQHAFTHRTKGGGLFSVYCLDEETHESVFFDRIQPIMEKIEKLKALGYVHVSILTGPQFTIEKESGNSETYDNRRGNLIGIVLSKE